MESKVDLGYAQIMPDDISEGRTANSMHKYYELTDNDEIKETRFVDGVA
jgi:hypothetical protein